MELACVVARCHLAIKSSDHGTPHHCARRGRFVQDLTLSHRPRHHAERYYPGTLCIWYPYTTASSLPLMRSSPLRWHGNWVLSSIHEAQTHLHTLPTPYTRTSILLRETTTSSRPFRRSYFMTSGQHELNPTAIIWLQTFLFSKKGTLNISLDISPNPSSSSGLPFGILIFPFCLHEMGFSAAHLYLSIFS